MNAPEFPPLHFKRAAGACSARSFTARLFPLRDRGKPIAAQAAEHAPVSQRCAVQLRAHRLPSSRPHAPRCVRSSGQRLGPRRHPGRAHTPPPLVPRYAHGAKLVAERGWQALPPCRCALRARKLRAVTYVPPRQPRPLRHAARVVGFVVAQRALGGPARHRCAWERVDTACAVLRRGVCGSASLV